LVKETEDPLSDAVCLGIEESIDDFKIKTIKNNLIGMLTHTSFRYLTSIKGGVNRNSAIYKFFQQFTCQVKPLI